MISPVTKTLKSLGGVYESDLADAEPIHFGDWQAEYQAAHDGVAVLDCSTTSKIEVLGRDRAKFLNNLCTNDINQLPAGAGCEAFFTNAQGKILFFVRVFAGAESVWINTVTGLSPALIAHLDRYLITEKVELIDRSDTHAQFLLIGPHASRCLAATLGTSVVELPDLGHFAATIGQHPCTVIFSTALKLPAYELRCPAEAAPQIWNSIFEAGQPELRPMGTQAFHCLRIEAGWPLAGVDIDDSNLPQEVGRTARAISFRKGCYLGQETVARIDALGHVNRHLVGLTVPGISGALSHGMAVSVASKVVGQVTSAARLPRNGAGIALAYVRRGFERPGTELIIACSGTPVPATVRALPNLGRG